MHNLSLYKAMGGIIRTNVVLPRCANSREHGRNLQGGYAIPSVPRTSGVYRITCAATGKVYIGSAHDLHRRWLEHQSSLRAGTHRNAHLQNAWDKHGATAFVFEVLKEVPVADLLTVEQAYLDQHQAYDRRYGYNIAPLTS